MSDDITLNQMAGLRSPIEPLYRPVIPQPDIADQLAAIRIRKAVLAMVKDHAILTVLRPPSINAIDELDADPTGLVSIDMELTASQINDLQAFLAAR